jgi:uncharacterized protein (UPF0276 family)
MATSPRIDPLAAAPELGVGILYNRSVAQFLRFELDGLDFVEFIPDLLRTDLGMGSAPRFRSIEEQVALMDWVAARRPVVAHSIGLSIGSAGLFDEEYVDELARWQRRYRFPWHSEHLSFARVAGLDGADHHAAIALPVPYDHDVLAVLAARVRLVQDAVEAPLLLENNVYFASIPEQEMTEPEFLNALAAETGCGLLLDLHNLHVNARNHGIDAAGFLTALDLTRVAEVHVAGGNELEGMYVDSHCGPCPEAVWEALAAVVPRAPNLRAVTFEFDESYYPALGADGVRAHLDRARDLWARRGGAGA